ncbi:hypothetical protein [Clostridium sp.]|uniref:hypothetical protein n=1 Tax=Clostridium sp. TaxID=1506 RepID=UPI00261D320E|nr:hypothetical protein [Clostridium sp.]
MLRLTIFEYIVRAIPEAFIFIFAGYILSNNKINIARYIISSLLYATCVYIIRMLPINYGVNTILAIIIQTIILNNINKFDLIQAVKSSILTTICLFILEMLNVIVLNYAFGDKLSEVMLNPILKVVYSLPSLICFAVIIICYHYSKKGKIKDVQR